jgi:hypothetical protein
MRCWARGTWGSEQAPASHAAKHARYWGGVAAYNQAAIDRIRRADRDVYLAVEQGTLKALFVEPYTSRRGPRKFRVTIMAVDSKRLVSQHIREALENDRYDVQPIKLPGRGIMKWLFG